MGAFVAPSPTPPSPTPPSPTPPTTGECVHQKDCDVSPWCRDTGFEAWCRNQGGSCPAPYCTRVRGQFTVKVALSTSSIIVSAASMCVCELAGVSQPLASDGYGDSHPIETIFSMQVSSRWAVVGRQQSSLHLWL